MRPRHLLAAWAIWWIVLLLRLTPAVVAVWKATRAAPGEGNVRLSIDNGIIDLVATIRGQTVWSGSTSFLSIVLLVAGPPLVMWVVWMAVKPERERVP
jgi:hypothetical protein